MRFCYVYATQLRWTDTVLLTKMNGCVSISLDSRLVIGLQPLYSSAAAWRRLLWEDMRHQYAALLTILQYNDLLLGCFQYTALVSLGPNFLRGTLTHLFSLAIWLWDIGKIIMTFKLFTQRDKVWACESRVHTNLPLTCILASANWSKLLAIESKGVREHDLMGSGLSRLTFMCCLLH